MQNLSVEQVAADTRISARFIQALEEEQFDVLPAPVYVRGFLRSYANYLRMDPQPLLDELSRYEEADGYVVRGPAPWRGPGAGTRQAPRSPSSDPFRPRPPAPAPGQQAAGFAPMLPPATTATGTDSEHPEWEPELDAAGDFNAPPEDSYDDYVYEEEPAWVARERNRGTQGVLLEKPVAIRNGGGPPRIGIAVAALALFGAAAVGAFFLSRDGDEGGVAAGQDGADETPVAEQTQGSLVEVRTPTPASEATPTATANGGTPAANATVSPIAEASPTAASDAPATPAPTEEPAPQPTQAPVVVPTTAPTVQPVVPTATPEPPAPTPTLEPPTATPTPAIVHPLGLDLCTGGTSVNPCGDPPLIVICGPNGYFIDPNGSYVNSGWPVSSASRIGEASSAC